MTDQEFYNQSKDLNTMFLLLKDLMKLEAFRYRLLVDNSPSGLECVYAKVCKRHSEETSEQTRIDALISQLRDLSAEIHQRDHVSNGLTGELSPS